MTAIVALHRALYHPGSLILCLAPALRQSQELFGKVLSFYRDLDRPIPAQAERKLSLELENESRIVTLPGTEKTIRGFSGAALLIVDEAARVADELYFAVRPMLAVSGGALMMLSTPYGKRGVFFEEWTGERVGALRGASRECPGSLLRFSRRSAGHCPARVYRQEYECSFEETEDQLFGYDLVAVLHHRRGNATVRGGFLGCMTVLRIVGVDLGQQRDPTAIAVIERGYVNAGSLYNAEYWLPGNKWRRAPDLRRPRAGPL